VLINDLEQAPVHCRPGNRRDALQEKVHPKRHVADQRISSKRQKDF
jgi:hypothetical protein